MAEAYAEIAPAAAHAQHMTSHIFLAMGMWDGVVDANITARNVQTSRQKELEQRTTVCGHYPWWLQYGYLQNGEAAEAAEVLSACHERIRNDPTDSELWHFAIMRAHQVVDGENWKDADTWTADIGSNDSGDINYLFTEAYASLMKDEVDQARQALAEMMKISSDAPELPIQVLQIQGLLLVKEGRSEDGLQLLREAVTAEEALPIDFGPPAIVKPSLELYADVLLASDRRQEAAQAYGKQLRRTPNRRLSLAGLASVTSARHP
jgi:tetratricopeptide (TPR) repeat protein